MIFKKIEDSAKSAEGLAKLLVLGSPPTDFLEEGITKEELIKTLKNSGNCTSIIATGILDTKEYCVSMRYRNEWKTFLENGDISLIKIPEVLEAAGAIVSGKKQPVDILKEVSKKYFKTSDDEAVLGLVLGEIIQGCRPLEWDEKHSCPNALKSCGKTGYLYYLLSTLTPKEGAKRSGIGLRLAYESTKNFFNEPGITRVNAHSYGIASRELLKKLGYKHIKTIKDFYPDTNPELRDAYLMCITKEKFGKMKSAYKNMGL